MNKMNSQQVKEMLLSCADKILRNEPFLTQTDSATGDGDHGIGMKHGMNAVIKFIDENPAENNIYGIYAGMAQAMETAMGGASGMIFSTLFAGKAKDKAPASEITPADLAAQMQDGLDAIQELGHAQEGDKTMVDALAPAVRAMKANTGSFEEMFKAAMEAAKEGAEKTKDYVAKFGRAKNLGKRALGHADAGACSTWLILTQMYDFVTGETTPDPEVEKKEESTSDVDIKWKKKIINEPENCIREELEGFIAAYGKDYELLPDCNGTVRKDIPEGKTALVIGGGSGHEPMFAFFLGEGLADAAANGNIFTSPDPDTITKTAKAADHGGGVLFIYGNYSGDCMNFDKAAENLAAVGIKSMTVRGLDDIASAPKERFLDRRGIAGNVPLMKIAGGACMDLSLEEAYRVSAKARDWTYSIGVGLDGATIPGQKNPIFSLPADEMEYGLGIHGEQGVERVKVQPADVIVEKFVNAIIEDSGLKAGDTVVTYVNGLGSTTLLELMVMNRKLKLMLDEKGIIVHDMDVNSLVTTQEMAGASITITKMDEELLKYYDRPCRSPYYCKNL